jgi:hypothetical protein
MPDSLQNYDMVTAISSRALFDLEKENEICKNWKLVE